MRVYLPASPDEFVSAPGIYQSGVQEVYARQLALMGNSKPPVPSSSHAMNNNHYHHQDGMAAVVDQKPESKRRRTAAMDQTNGSTTPIDGSAAAAMMNGNAIADGSAVAQNPAPTENGRGAESLESMFLRSLSSTIFLPPPFPSRVWVPAPETQTLIPPVLGARTEDLVLPEFSRAPPLAALAGFTRNGPLRSPVTRCPPITEELTEAMVQPFLPTVQPSTGFSDIVIIESTPVVGPMQGGLSVPHGHVVWFIPRTAIQINNSHWGGTYACFSLWEEPLYTVDAPKEGNSSGGSSSSPASDPNGPGSVLLRCPAPPGATITRVLLTHMGHVSRLNLNLSETFWKSGFQSLKQYLENGNPEPFASLAYMDLGSRLESTRY